ncbi:MAG: hypothetical protein KKA62_03360 [Nanoarchaeota archaeon]|nr:hypothetical protein [Nanoarchaeota archaeon]MBU1976963.1 hypothetical protein [Nanoarchaeota archaeon]
MNKCHNCDKKIGILSKKYYIYPGNKKGDLTITEEKISCKNCIFDIDDSEQDIRQEVVVLMVGDKFKEALIKLNKVFNKESSSDWYSKGNLLRNLKKNLDALDCYDEALLLDTHYVKCWYRKGWLLKELKEYKKAAQCFSNVIELEKSSLNENSIKVYGDENNYKYEINVWTFAAIISKALTLMNLKKFDEADMTFTILYRTVGHFPPFASIEDKDFISYCVQNWDKILDLLEPRVVAGFLTIGARH